MTTLTTYKTAASSDRAAVKRILLGLQEMDWEPKSYHDGEEHHAIPGFFASHDEIADHLMSTDEAALVLQKGEEKGAVYFVFGNSPWEVAADSGGSDVFLADLETVETAINLEGV